MTQTVVGVFDTPDAAQAAEEELVSRGIDRSAVHLAATESAAAVSGETRQERHGTMGGIRNFFSELFGTGHSDEVGHYSEAIRRGGVMLAVDLPDGADIEPVRDVLADAGAIDIDRRVEHWRQQGWSGYNPEAQPYTPDEIAQERNTVLPVVQEAIEVGKRAVAKGSVRVYSRTVETPVQESVNLREEHATVERRPVDRPATPADVDAFTDKSVEIQEMAEKPVVSKSARVVEEVVVGKEVTQSTEVVQDTVRHTEVEVERGSAAEGATGASSYFRPYEDYEPDYRRDFQTRFGTQGGGSYDDYAPAYRYGHTLAGDPRYEGRPWAEIEPQARLDWERQYPNSTWERFKLAIQNGWERVTGRH